MTTLNFNDSYLKRIISHLSVVDQDTFSTEKLLPEEVEFEVALSLDDQISAEDHIAFIEATQKLAETLISCTVGVFETRKQQNKIAPVGLIKMLSQLFLVGHQACENRLKYKWTKHGTRKIEEKIEVYKHLSNTIISYQQEQKQQEVFEESLQLEETSENLREQVDYLRDVKQEELEIIEINDDEEIPPPPAQKKSKIMSTDSGKNGKNNFNSVTEGCQHDSGDEIETSMLSTLITDQSSSLMTNCPEPCLIFANGVSVGYSTFGKQPILIVAHLRIKDNVYVYRYMEKGKFRCIDCGYLNIHRYARLYQGILYSHLHECEGKPQIIVENEQLSRAQRLNFAPLPSLLELSTLIDPRPYPPYPRKMNRPQKPNYLARVIEYSKFSSCITEHFEMRGCVAYDNYNPKICYEYSLTQRGFYRCVSCFRLGRNTMCTRDPFGRVLKSAEHVCKGISIDEFNASQAQRRQLISPTKNDELHNFGFCNSFCFERFL